MSAQTLAQRQSAYRASKKAQGLKELRNIWVDPKQEAEVKRYLQTVLKLVETKGGKG